ncbi:hypothetical protein NPX13_g8270 [Xylaria arbuscula]|uniref:Uncharacterized protein n=1 Tax=Xylaria arbuscula TaxID=114810 RepID=A0A9W8TK01_9PEZI|nr:hypothetical protein NPX13_g8270 [Xylaria arbuscula]
MRIKSPPDPRNLLPSRADPEHRQRRKKLEKEHPFGLTEFVSLGLIGLTLAWDIDKQVEKCAEKKGKEDAIGEQQARRDEGDRRRRDKEHYDRTPPDRRRDHRGRGSESGSRSSQKGRQARGMASERYGYDPRRRQSVGYYRDDTRRDDDRYHDYKPRYDPRDDYRSGSRYDDRRGSEPPIRRRSRRDSL